MYSSSVQYPSDSRQEFVTASQEKQIKISFHYNRARRNHTSFMLTCLEEKDPRVGSSRILHLPISGSKRVSGSTIRYWQVPWTCLGILLDVYVFVLNGRGQRVRRCPSRWLDDLQGGASWIPNVRWFYCIHVYIHYFWELFTRGQIPQLKIRTVVAV